jgi:hypothetical protein
MESLHEVCSNASALRASWVQSWPDGLLIRIEIEIPSVVETLSDVSVNPDLNNQIPDYIGRIPSESQSAAD